MRRFCCVKILEIRGEVTEAESEEITLRVLPGMTFTERPGQNMVTKPPYIRLECLDTMWIEVLPEILAEYFEEVFY